MSQTPAGTVMETGAAAGSILVGIRDHNAGLLIRVGCTQQVGEGGQLSGAIEVLDAGTGYYSDSIRALLERESVFNSAPVLIDKVRQIRGGENGSHTVNANGLWRLDVKKISDRILEG